MEVSPFVHRRLALCHFTMIEVEPPAFVELAARTGFDAVSLMLQFPASYGQRYPMTGDTRMLRETRRRLDDTGVALFDAGVCRLEPQTPVEDFAAMIEAAAYLGAHHIDVNGSDPDPDRLTDRFAALCELAASHGLAVGLEFMMSTEVKTLGDALSLIERSEATNAAITVDALHLIRSSGSAAEVAALETS